MEQEIAKMKDISIDSSFYSEKQRQDTYSDLSRPSEQFYSKEEIVIQSKSEVDADESNNICLIEQVLIGDTTICEPEPAYN